MRTDYRARTFARRFARSRALSPAAREIWAAALAKATGARRVRLVIDVGAGTGRFWPVFRDAWAPELIVAADSSPAMVLHGGSNPDVQKVVGDIDAFPLADCVADVCFCSMVLQYSTEPVAALDRLRSTLKPGGLILIRTGTATTIASFDFLKFFPSALAAERAAMPAEQDVTAWLAAAGLRDIVAISVSVTPARSGLARFRQVLGRGFPSLQLVPSTELAIGLVRYAFHLLWSAVRRAEPVSESVLFVAARRRVEGHIHEGLHRPSDEQCS